MAFRGLFIGIDRYRSPAIGDLSCARRDATALDALFADTLGGDSRLLTDADATRSAIEARIRRTRRLQCRQTRSSSRFSGHGSETHETDPVRRRNRGSQHHGHAPRSASRMVRPYSGRAPCLLPGLLLLGRLGLESAADGRQAARSQVGGGQARPNRRRRTVDLHRLPGRRTRVRKLKDGHGFLTLFLIEALRGATEVVLGSRIPVYRLLDHVSARVSAAAAADGLQQHPTMKGRIEGDLHWPIFTEGARFAAAFPDRRGSAVTSDLASLQAAGFPQQLVEAWATAIPSLNPLQILAINDYGVLNGAHLVVSAPTSSGKTMVGELAALRAVLDRRRAIFLLPLKALVADKRRHFNSVYGSFGIRTVEATGETDDISPVLRGKYDVALLTYEKFASIALTFPHVLAGAGVVVIDEAQMIADESRGANLEFLLTLIRMRRREGIEPQTIALSAVIGDTNGFEGWLGGRLLRRTERPVPLDEGVLRADGTFRFIDAMTGAEKVEGPIIRQEYRKGSSQDWIVPLVRLLVSKGQQVIVFREIKAEARGIRGISGRITRPSANPGCARPVARRRRIPGQCGFPQSAGRRRWISSRRPDAGGTPSDRGGIPPRRLRAPRDRGDYDPRDGRQHSCLVGRHRWIDASGRRALFGRRVQESGRQGRTARLCGERDVLSAGDRSQGRLRLLEQLRHEGARRPRLQIPRRRARTQDR